LPMAEGGVALNQSKAPAAAVRTLARS